MRARTSSAILPGVEWNTFWALITLLEGAADEDGCEQLTEELTGRSAEDIIGFAERLAEALFWLDQECFGLIPVADLSEPDEPFEQSDDFFLYSRCAVVAAGREAYAEVFADPELYGRYTASDAMYAEPLLYVAARAYEQLTGADWEHATQYERESYSNSEGWSGRHREEPALPEFLSGE